MYYVLFSKHPGADEVLGRRQYMNVYAAPGSHSAADAAPFPRFRRGSPRRGGGAAAPSPAGAWPPAPPAGSAEEAARSVQGRNAGSRDTGQKSARRSPAE